MDYGVVVEGYLHKRGRVGGEIVRRWYRLLDDGTLLWQKSKFAVEAKGRVQLTGKSKLGPGKERGEDELWGFEFEDGENGRVRELLASSASEREVWVHSLCSVIASLNNDREAVEAVRRRAVAYASAAAAAGRECVEQLLRSPLPGEQVDVDLAKLSARGLVMAGCLNCRRGPWGTFKQRSFELTTTGVLRFFDECDDDHQYNNASKRSVLRRMSPSARKPQRRNSKKRVIDDERESCFSVDVLECDVAMDRTERQCVTFRSGRETVELRCMSQAQRNDVVFGVCVIAEVKRLLDESTAIAAARRRSHVVHDAKVDTDVRVACVTWNANEREVEESEVRLVAAKAGDVDMLALSVQEVAPRLAALATPLAAAARWDEVWAKVLAERDLSLLEACSLGPTRICLYVKRDCLWRISRVSADAVACGNAGAANKGAAAVKCFAGQRSLVFIGAHLAAHAAHHRRRDVDARRIDDKLFVDAEKPPQLRLSQHIKTLEDAPAELPPPDCDHDDGDDEQLRNRLKRIATDRLLDLVDRGDLSRERFETLSSELEYFWRDDFVSHLEDEDDDDELGEPLEVQGGPPKRRPASRLVSSHSAVFLLGDLNYRVDLHRDDAERLVRDAFVSTDDERLLPAHTALEVLLSRDQLLHRLRAGSYEYFDFPTGFSEQPISFPPTFKYDPGTQNFESTKLRVPSWCDRVLFSPNSILEPLSYDSIPGAASSDHRPVVATFALRLSDSNDSPALDVNCDDAPQEMDLARGGPADEAAPAPVDP